MWWGWMERTEGGWVRSSPTGPVKVAFDSPACAECDAHFFIFFPIFIQFLQSCRNPNPDGQCGVDTLRWVGCMWVWKTKKAAKMENRHQSGQPSALRRMHIFSHFSEFLLIFQHGSILTKIAPLCVCVRSFEKTQLDGYGGKESSVPV